MIDLDTYLLEFCRTNLVSLGIISAVLYKIADRRGWTWLKDIIDVIRNKVGSKPTSKVGP